MTNQPITQSQKRFQDSLGSLFHSDPASPRDFIFIKSSSDVGVERNGGRNGARLAPKSFLAYFKKLNKKPQLAGKHFFEIETADTQAERSNFHEAQKQEAARIHETLKNHASSFICHLGGGHDHIYPLLKALGESYNKIIVINIDAHADTRTDAEYHSGTPFRQFANEYAGNFHLYQTGLLEFANSISTLSPLEKGVSKTLWRHELSKLDTFFADIKKEVTPAAAVIFSLDADALNGADMPGVSAVNGNGITRAELNAIWQAYSQLGMQHGPIMGIYELNPVYDSLSMVSMRTLGSFVYEAL